MKNTQKPFRVFLDTSVLLSGLNSPFGASGFIISLFKLRKIIVVISPEVVIEAEKVIKNKLPLLKIPFLDLLTHKPILAKKISQKELRFAYSIINSEDAPIFAGFVKTKSDVLVTLDKKFQMLVKNKTKYNVFSPGEFLQKYQRKFSE